MDDFEIIVATQDWHPPEHGSFEANLQPFDVAVSIDEILAKGVMVE